MPRPPRPRDPAQPPRMILRAQGGGESSRGGPAFSLPLKRLLLTPLRSFFLFFPRVRCVVLSSCRLPLLTFAGLILQHLSYSCILSSPRILQESLAIRGEGPCGPQDSPLNPEGDSSRKVPPP